MIKIANVRFLPTSKFYVGELEQNGASERIFFKKWSTMPSGRIALLDGHDSIIVMVDFIESNELIIDINDYDSEYSEVGDSIGLFKELFKGGNKNE